MTPAAETRWYELYVKGDLPGMLPCKPPAGIDQDVMLKTGPIEGWPDHATCTLAPGARLFDLLGVRPPWRIMSDRAASVIREMGDGAVETLPVFVVRADTGEEIPGYSVVHVMREVAAFDWEHGSYQVWKGKLSVVRMALVRGAIEGIPVFRLAEAPERVVLSEHIVRRLGKIGASGFYWGRLGTFQATPGGSECPQSIASSLAARRVRHGGNT